jgi:predicted secreted Zn-dependent protease
MLGSTLLMCQTIPICAQPTFHTTYSNFPVHGDSLPELHSDMASHGPTANGLSGYGTTSVSPGKQMSVAACKRNGDYHFSIEFQIRLPKVTNPTTLPVSELALWKSFARFVKQHEEVHRSIWMNCAVIYDRKLQASAPQDCASGQAKVAALWSDMLATCGPKQMAFDAAQRSALKAHPFMIRLAHKVPYQ